MSRYTMIWMVLFFIIIGCTNIGLSQEVIVLSNPSFEDMPRRGGDFNGPIKGWVDCGLNIFPGESPPDLHPVPGTAWEVTKLPQHGKTFLGLVVRYNNSYESLSQRLESPLEKDKCYLLTVQLARSDAYKSRTTRSQDKAENFVQPAILQIWGGREFCEEKQLLAQSIPVENNEWMVYDFKFTPDENFKAITIVAFYADGSQEAYNGHVMVDNLSPIVEIDCDK